MLGAGELRGGFFGGLHLLLCLEHLGHGALPCQQKSSCCHLVHQLNCGDQELLCICSRARRSRFGCGGRLTGRGDGHRILWDVQLCSVVSWGGVQVHLDQGVGQAVRGLWSSLLLPWWSTGGILGRRGRKSFSYCHHLLLLQEGNPRGCGVFVLHTGSRVVLDSSKFDGNKWSGFGCRWSGGGSITNCTFDSNGQVQPLELALDTSIYCFLLAPIGALSVVMHNYRSAQAFVFSLSPTSQCHSSRSKLIQQKSFLTMALVRFVLKTNGCEEYICCLQDSIMGLLQGAWAIRKSTIKDVVRSGNTVTNDFTDKSYSKVCELHRCKYSKGV